MKHYPKWKQTKMRGRLKEGGNQGKNWLLSDADDSLLQIAWASAALGEGREAGQVTRWAQGQAGPRRAERSQKRGLVWALILDQRRTMLEGGRFEGEGMIAAGKAAGDRSGLYDCWKGAERADQRAGAGQAATMMDVGRRAAVEDGVCNAEQRRESRRALGRRAGLKETVKIRRRGSREDQMTLWCEERATDRDRSSKCRQIDGRYDGWAAGQSTWA